MGWFNSSTSPESENSSQRLYAGFKSRMFGNKMFNDELSEHYGGSMKKHEDEKRNELTKLKVYGLDAFQVRAEEEMNLLQLRKVGLLEKYFRAHDPTSEIRRWWDLVSICVIIVSVFAAMFEYSFEVSVERGSRLLVILFNGYFGFCTVFFWLDLVYNFFTAFYNDEGELEFEHYFIAMNYFKTYFLIDLVSNLPLTGPWGLLKAFRMHRMSRVLTRWSYLGYDPTKLQVFKLFILIITIGHFLACAFFMVSKYDYDNTFREEAWELAEDRGVYRIIDVNGEDVDVKNWIIADAAIDPNLLKSMNDVDFVVTSEVMSAYLTSMYFAYSTLTTVGYGDISAHTDIERSIAIISLIAGSVIYAVLVGIMNNLVDSSDVKETEYQKQLTNVNTFMNNHHLPSDLRTRVRRYMELDHNSSHRDIASMVDFLSPMLQREVIMHMNRHFVADVPFLADADRIFVWCLLERMDVIVCVAKEYILVEGEQIEAIHIIKSGKVDVISSSGLIIRTYTQGSFFGENCGNEDKSYAVNSYRAKMDMEIAIVPQNELKVLLDAFPEFHETLGLICNARMRHEKREMEVFEEKMEKMIKQTGMKARPITPPPGKTWQDQATGRRVSTRERSVSGGGGDGRSSPMNGTGQSLPELTMSSTRADLLEGLEKDIKGFDASEKRKTDLEMSRNGSLNADSFAALRTVQAAAIKKGVSTISPKSASADTGSSGRKEGGGGIDEDEKESDDSSGDSDSDNEDEQKESLTPLSSSDGPRRERHARSTAESEELLRIAKKRGATMVSKGGRTSLVKTTSTTPNNGPGGRRLSVGGGASSLPPTSVGPTAGRKNTLLGGRSGLTPPLALSPQNGGRGLTGESEKLLFESLEKLLNLTTNLDKKISDMDARLAEVEKGTK
jgi:CRP-like cAMP-binding protein